MKVNNKLLLLIFIIVALLIINKKERDNFTNVKYDYDFCEEYEKDNQHCPYRVKYKPGMHDVDRSFELNLKTSNNDCNCKKDIKPLYDQDLLADPRQEPVIVKPKCAEKQNPEFIMFAGKYPVHIKNNNKNNNTCGK